MKLFKLIKDYNFRIKNYPKLYAKYKAILNSEKVVIINPKIEINGLEKLTRPLYIDGNNLLFQNITMNLKGKLPRKGSFLYLF